MTSKRRWGQPALPCAIFAAFAVLAAAQCVCARAADDAREFTRPDAYQADPLLADAVKYWSSHAWERRDRNLAISLFQKYIDAAPDSPFLPEIYFRIGEMYDGGQPGKPQDQTDYDLAARYYELAHQAYGEKYCFGNDTAWRRLVSLSGNLPKLREYYDWLKRINSSGTADDVHPTRGMTWCVRGWGPKMSDDAKLDILQSSKMEIAANISAMEESIVLVAAAQTSVLGSPGASELALDELVKAYPGTRLATLAQEILDRKRAETTDEMGRQVALRFDMSDEDSQTSPDSLASTGPSLASSPTPPTTPEPQKPPRRTNTTALALATVVLVLLAAFLFIRARRSARSDS